MKLTESQLRQYIYEAIAEYTNGMRGNELDTALVRCGINGLGGQELIRMIAEAAEEKAKYDFAPDMGEDEGIYDVDLFVGDGQNDIGGDFPETFYMEANVRLECHEVRDRGDYYTPPYSETFIDGCAKASLFIYNDEDLVYKSDITYEVDSMLSRRKKRRS